METILPNQRQRMAIVDKAKNKMACTTAELRVQQSLKSKLHTSTDFNVFPGDKFIYFLKTAENGMVRI